MTPIHLVGGLSDVAQHKVRISDVEVAHTHARKKEALITGISRKRGHVYLIAQHSPFIPPSILESKIMKFSALMSIKAIVCLFFGVGLVLLPTTMMSFYGVTLDAGGTVMTQLFGQAFFLLGLLLWLMRNTTEASTVKAFSISLFLGDAVGVVVSLMAVISGVVNALGWTTVALYLVIGLGFGYFWLKPPTAS